MGSGFPALPTGGAGGAGLVNIYALTSGGVTTQALANFLWSDAYIDTVKKAMKDPYGSILGMHMVPIPTNRMSATVSSIKLGSMDSGCSANLLTGDFVRMDFGSQAISPRHPSGIGFLDFEPYTKFKIYLPYVGESNLPAALIMGKTVQVIYHVHVASGDLTAMIGVIDGSGTHVIAQFKGSCGVPLPVTAENNQAALNGAMGAIGSIVKGGLSGGLIGAAGAAVGEVGKWLGGAEAPDTMTSGSVGGAAGWCGVQTPYITRINQDVSVAGGLNGIRGRASNVGTNLANVTGYTEVAEVHIKNILATTSELEEIEGLLKEGVEL